MWRAYKSNAVLLLVFYVIIVYNMCVHFRHTNPNWVSLAIEELGTVYIHILMDIPMPFVILIRIIDTFEVNVLYVTVKNYYFEAGNFFCFKNIFLFHITTTYKM